MLFANIFKILSNRWHKRKNFKVSEQYLVDVYNLIPSIVIGLDMECCILHLNRAAEKFIGCSVDTVMGKPVQSLIPELASYMGLIMLSLETKQFTTFSKVKISLDKTEHFVKIVAYLFEKAGVTLYINDITEHVFMENVLVQTEKMTTLGTLAAGMAHEINNALSGILQSIQNINRRLDLSNQKNLEIAKENGVSLEQVKKYLEIREITQFMSGMKELGEHASLVVKNVLKFSRRSDNEMVAVDINSLVQDTLSIVLTDYDIKKQLKYNKLIIHNELAENIPKLYCVPSEIEQVLLNLIKNASHALADKTFVDGKATITIRTQAMQDHVRIEVADNGPGVLEQHRQHLFKPFFTTKPIGVGTGLGLSISYYIIVDKHQGKLELESTVGDGATFIIELPITKPLIEENSTKTNV